MRQVYFRLAENDNEIKTINCALTAIILWVEGSSGQPCQIKSYCREMGATFLEQVSKLIIIVMQILLIDHYNTEYTIQNKQCMSLLWKTSWLLFDLFRKDNGFHAEDMVTPWISIIRVCKRLKEFSVMHDRCEKWNSIFTYKWHYHK